MTVTSTVPVLASFRDIIGLWRSPEAMAEAIGAGVAAVRKWAQRDRIPSEWWDSILASDTGRNGGVTADLLTRLAAEKRSPAMSEARA